MALASINQRLGFDFWKKYEEYLDSGTDDRSKSPVNLLTKEEIDFLISNKEN